MFVRSIFSKAFLRPVTGAVLFLVVTLVATAQNINPGEDKVFRPAELTWIFLTMSPADKAFILDPANALSETYFPATFRMKNSLMDTTLTANVGVRLRGNTSRYAEKKSLKIDFREFGGKKFFEYKKINLKANVNDPSFIREPLTLQQYREINVPAARTNHVKLYINDEFMGVYLNVEQLDDVFLTMRFGHSQGWLYKCSWGANLSNPGQAMDVALMESEINKGSDTRTQVSHFIQVLNETTDQDFSVEIEKVFDVDLYLRQLAVESMMGHWDGYSYNQNNFYLYYNGQSGKVAFLPYDVDNTWGIDWLGQDWGTFNITAWVNPGQPRPLTKRILAVPAYRDLYNSYLKQLVETSFNHAFIDPQLSFYVNMLSMSVYQDTYYPRAFGFNHNDFLASFHHKMNNHVKYGLSEYLDKRTRFAAAQLPDVITSATEKKKESQLFPNPSSSPLVYYYSSTGPAHSIVVYSSTGIPVDAWVRSVDDHTVEVTLPEGTPHGLYLLKSSDSVMKWIYR